MSGGGSLGLGKQKSDSSSTGQSTSESFGSNVAISGDSSTSYGSSVSGGQSSTTQDIAFEDVFSQLYGGASSAAKGALANADQLGEVARSLFSGGSQFLEGIGGDAGSNYLTGRLTGQNPALQDEIDLLREDTGRLFSEELNPAITSRAVAGGTLGGGRQGVAQGLAMEASANSFARGAAALRSEDMARKDAAAMEIARNSLTGAQTGLGALPGLLELASAEHGAELGIYGQLSQILGGPTVLSESGSTDFSQSSQQSIAEAFARSYGEQRGTSQATNSSVGKARGWNFNMSGYGGVMAQGE
jgi:hypothetical protein